MGVNFTLPFRPLKVNNVIRRKGDYTAVIMGARFETPPTGGALLLDYTIPNGKYAGFCLRSQIHPQHKGKIVLSYLLNALGLNQLDDVDQLVGRRLILSVVPQWNEHTRRYTHKVTLFYPVEKGNNRHIMLEDNHGQYQILGANSSENGSGRS